MALSQQRRTLEVRGKTKPAQPRGLRRLIS
jgi:hypothetical protein